MLTMILLQLSLAQAQTKTVVCYDKQEKLVEMPVLSAQVKSNKETVVKTARGELTINLRCVVK